MEGKHHLLEQISWEIRADPLFVADVFAPRPEVVLLHGRFNHPTRKQTRYIVQNKEECGLHQRPLLTRKIEHADGEPLT